MIIGLGREELWSDGGCSFATGRQLEQQEFSSLSFALPDPATT